MNTRDRRTFSRAAVPSHKKPGFTTLSKCHAVNAIKEVANDYRYFPEPDLLPIIIDAEYIEAVRPLPELPGAKRARFTAHYGLNDYDAALLVPNHALADYFESVLQPEWLRNQPRTRFWAT